MGTDIALILGGWLMLVWVRMSQIGRVPSVLRRLLVQPGSRSAEALLAVGFTVPGVVIVDRTMQSAEGEPAWLRIVWAFLVVLIALVVGALLFAGPRTVVDGILRRAGRGGTTQHHTPSKSRVAP